MIKKVVVGFGLVAMVVMSGCSDTEESLKQEKKELEQRMMAGINDCLSGKMDKDECSELKEELESEEKELLARIKAFNEDNK